jgi:hypothetical protein
VTFDPEKWQREAAEAFAFLFDLYQQAAAVFSDARRHYEGAGWAVVASSKHGGVAYEADIGVDKSPYVYFKGIVAEDPAPRRKGEQWVAFFAIDFDHESPRIRGPYALFGAARIASGARLNHWAIHAAGGNNSLYDSFEISGDRPRTATPNDDGSKRYPGVQEVRYFELPLGRLAGQEALRGVVEASIALAKGDDAVGKALGQSLGVR